MPGSDRNLIPIITAVGVGTILGYGASLLTRKAPTETTSSSSGSSPKKAKQTITGMPVEIKPDKVFHVPHLRETAGEKHNKHRINIKFMKSRIYL